MDFVAEQKGEKMDDRDLWTAKDVFDVPVDAFSDF